MKNFIVYEKSSGKVIASGTSFKPESNKDSQHDVLITDSVLDIYGIYVMDGAVVKLPEKPSGYYIFNYQTKSWDQDKDSCVADVLKYERENLQKATGRSFQTFRWQPGALGQTTAKRCAT